MALMHRQINSENHTFPTGNLSPVRGITGKDEARTTHLK